MELIGIQRVRGRDLATGIVLGLGFGLAALFLYLGTNHDSTTGAHDHDSVRLDLRALARRTCRSCSASAHHGRAIVALYRPLLLVSVSPELAAARGIPVRAVGAAYLIAMAVAVALSALTIGAILSTALLVGPAATALRLTRRPHRAILAAAGSAWRAHGSAAARLGQLLLAALQHGWPVSFFIVTLVLLGLPGVWLR